MNGTDIYDLKLEQDARVNLFNHIIEIEPLEEYRVGATVDAIFDATHWSEDGEALGLLNPHLVNFLRGQIQKCPNPSSYWRKEDDKLEQLAEFFLRLAFGLWLQVEIRKLRKLPKQLTINEEAFRKQ